MTRRLTYIFILCLLMAVQSYAQTDIKAVRMALAQVIHNHREPQCGDTVAVKLSQKFSKSAEMQTAIAMAYLQNSNREKAEHYLAKANNIEHDGIRGYAPALILQGDILRDNNYVDSATVYYERAMQIDPRNPDSYVNMAMMYARYGNTERGIQIMEQLRTALPTYNVDGTIADLYSVAQDQRGATTYFEKTDFNLLRKDQVLSYAIGLYEQQKYAEGIELLGKAKEKWPQDKQVSRLLLWHCSAAQQYDEAIKHGTQYLDKTPEDSVWSIDHYAMGCSYLLTDQYDAAFEAFRKCQTKTDAWKAVQRNIPSVFTIATNRLREEKRYEEALALQRRFIEFRGSSATARNYVGIIQTLNAQLTDKDDQLRTREDAQPLIDACKKYERDYPQDENVDYVMFIHWRWLTVFDKEMDYVALPEAQRLYKYLDTYPDRDKGQDSRLIQVIRYIASYNYFKLRRVTYAKSLWKRILEIDPNDEVARKALGM